MPGYRVHIAGGVVTFLGIAFLISKFSGSGSLTAGTLLQGAVACILGSLFPDVDTKSKGQGIFYKVMVVCLLLLLWKKQISLFVLVSFFAFIPVLVRHRGIFHRVWFIVAGPLVLAFMVSQSFPAYESLLLSSTLFFIGGALSHIALDKIPYLS